VPDSCSDRLSCGIVNAISLDAGLVENLAILGIDVITTRLLNTGVFYEFVSVLSRQPLRHMVELIKLRSQAYSTWVLDM
jgi:hypothetical protein